MYQFNNRPIKQLLHVLQIYAKNCSEFLFAFKTRIITENKTIAKICHCCASIMRTFDYRPLYNYVDIKYTVLLG